MKPFVANIEKKTRANENFREVLHTEQHSQVVVMSLLPKEDIGMEVHEIVDQFIRIEVGTGKAIIDGVEHAISDGFAVLVPAGAKHNIINTSADEKMKIYTVYCPAHHKDGTVHKTKEDANKDKEDHI